MNEPKFIVTMRDVQRYKILKDVLDKKLKGAQAAVVLGLSYVHISRLKRKVKERGLQGLLRPRYPPKNKIPDSQRKIIAALYREYYPDFNIMHFKDKLSEIHHKKLSYESIRQILIGERDISPKRKRSFIDAAGVCLKPACSSRWTPPSISGLNRFPKTGPWWS